MVSRALRAVTVVMALVVLGALPAAGAAVPQPQRLGYCGGDDWEPAMAIQGSYVVVAITHYVGDTTCDPASGNAAAIYAQVSSNGGKTFSVPGAVWTQPVGGTSYPSQADPSVAIDPSGNVYVSFLGYGNSGGHTDIVVAKSTNHGVTFSSAVKANAKDCKNCDHPKLLAAGSNLYIAYSQAQYHFIAMSKDGGATWTQSTVDATDVVGFAEGGVVDSHGNVYYAWADCQSSSCGGVPAADYRVSKTTAGTLTTTFTNVASGVQGPDCSFSQCGFSYWGPQDDIGIDGNGDLYLVWQQGQVSTTRKSPPIINLSRSTDGGATWTFVGRVDDKTASGCAGSACYALYPTIVGGAGTTIDVAWMDDRNGSPINHTNGWNVWLRTSTNMGNGWTGPSQKMSFYDPSQSQSQSNGFDFPYGDYFGLAVNTCGSPALTWGEGHNWVGGPTAPGHIEFRTLC